MAMGQRAIAEQLYATDGARIEICEVKELLNPRPAGPSPDPTRCWEGGGGERSGPPSISETNRRRGKIQTAMERPGRDLSDKV